MKTVEITWLYSLKRRILFGILAILSLSIIATTVFVYLALRDGLAQNSARRTQELGGAIRATLRHLMIARSPAAIQATLEGLTERPNGIVKAFLLDRRGRIAYSTDRKEIGRHLDRFTNRSCLPCHGPGGGAPDRELALISGNGSEIVRTVMVIYNEPACHRCHAPSQRINGKLIIDRSLQDSYALITLVELILFGSAVVCLALLIPFLSRVLSRGMDRYITEIISRHTELSILYAMIKQLSRTINTEELKVILFEILRETLEADVIDIIFPRDWAEFRATTWNRRENTIDRKKIDEQDPLSRQIVSWLAGRTARPIVSTDRSEVVLPVSKGDVPLALIAVRRAGQPFKEDRLALTDIMYSHIAVALENARLYHIAITDELTKLYTQRHFRTCLEKSFNDHQSFGEKFTLLMIDIDDFKKINDTHGHLVGDAVLRGISRVIASSVRDNDLVFRYGGEEFAALLPSTPIKAGRQVAGRIREAVEAERFEGGTAPIRLTVSIGVSACPETANTIRELITTADKRLYEAKRAGKNRIVGGEE